MPQLWFPNQGPQTAALNSPADILFYGGAAGGGKSDLLIGAAVTQHRRSVLFRREGTQLRALEDRALQIIGDAGRYNSTSKVYRLYDGRLLEFGAVKDAGDEEKHQGRPHDLIGYDEITHFTELQFRFLMGWNRTTIQGQRCRVLAAGNPPFTAEGDWVISYWGPWLDKKHPNPAQPGELRWFASIKGKDVERPNGLPFENDDGKIIKPKSRSFIPSKVEDNPDLMATDYASTLDALPEPLRTMMREGNFGAAQEDHPFQVIPTAWVLQAQARWRERTKPEIPMTAIGVDVARGGKDKSVFSPRYGNWFAPQIVYPGSSTPNGPVLVQQLLTHIDGRPRINIDCIGVGSSPLDKLQELDFDVVPMNGAESTDAMDKSGQLGFFNCRAEWYWKLREALDPTSGEELALPDDRELLADLTAARWELKARGILVEEKKKIIERIGRSPDKGDSLVYAHAVKYMPGGGIFEFYRQQAQALQQQRP
jgi:hypothetical protein